LAAVEVPSSGPLAQDCSEKCGIVNLALHYRCRGLNAPARR